MALGALQEVDYVSFALGTSATGLKGGWAALGLGLGVPGLV